jgi:hypothetical protein
MIKKLLKISRFLIIGIIWSYIYAFLTSYITIYFWKFNILSINSWKIISAYWNNGGIIKTSNDYIFLFTLLIIFVIWLIGLIILRKKSLLGILLAPVFLYNDHIIKKYGEDSKRIILKNMGISKKTDIKELVEKELNKKAKDIKKERIDVRGSISKKIMSIKK